VAAVTAAGYENIQNRSGNLERVRQDVALCCNGCHEVSGHHWGTLIENDTTKNNTPSVRLINIYDNEIRNKKVRVT
jgi:hypothetical protein